MPHTWIEISESALLHNSKQFRQFLQKDVKLIATIKANAYGHGLVPVAQTVQDHVDYLAVINLAEARQLREAGIHAPILVLGYIDESVEAVAWAITERVEIAVNSKTHAERLSELAEKHGEGSPLRVHIKIDTGMGRMGILHTNALEYIPHIATLPGLYIRGIMSHFADIVGHRDYSKQQLERFQGIQKELAKKKLEPSLWHIAKTEAILDFPESEMNAVRLGIGLYGIWPDRKLLARVKENYPDFKLKPSLTWKASILQVKDYPKGEYVGYGCTHQTARQTRIAILPVGYYEGYDRGLSNKGEVLIKGNRCPIIGRICMNMCMADVTDVVGVRRGDEVVLLGSQGDEEISAREMAGWIDTIGYEVVTRINPVIERRLVK